MTTIARDNTRAEDEDDAVTEEEDAVEPDAGDEGEGDTRAGRRWLPHARKAVIVLVVMAALAGVGVLGWTVWRQHQLARAGQDAQQAAVAYAQILTSIDSGKVDENFNEVINGATGEFKDMYSQASVELRQLLVDNKATAHGVVVESAVQSATTTRAVVLLFVDQSITNTNVPDPRIDRSRIKMTMEKVDDRWRASKVELP